MTKERSDERYRNLALHDELTGLDNRRAILRSLEQQASLARRSAQPLTLLMMDIDHFKRVNDSFGHVEGDKVLRMVANSITARLRTQDLVGRFGGEEFLALLPATTAQGGYELAEALRKGIAESRIAAPDGRTIAGTISIGVHQVGESSGEALADLINAADQALYRAKDNGRNRVEIG
jgi:diguanylate cyclase (GGDEF)-like protein